MGFLKNIIQLQCIFPAKNINFSNFENESSSLDAKKLTAMK